MKYRLIHYLTFVRDIPTILRSPTGASFERDDILERSYELVIVSANRYAD
ncbi:MAG TPA: hypothetical protein H9825_01190 [Candidatus Sphingobacterium stercorigallinarum]|nr:hypothetical protein [Candidatus Sphingobacterium stercorigallinarum]